MTNIQMLLALGAMILLSLIIINVSKNSLYTEHVMYNSNFGITATSIASSIIEDANKLKFDSITDTMALDPSKNANLLTAPGSLGTESGENKNDPRTYNDFDDYDGYTTEDSTMPTAKFDISCKVDYVEPDNPDVPVSYRTFHKKIIVKVWSRSMRDTMIQSSVFSYWYSK